MARFELGDDVGYGLHEYSLMGAHDNYGFKISDDVAPSRAIAPVRAR